MDKKAWIGVGLVIVTTGVAGGGIAIPLFSTLPPWVGPALLTISLMAIGVGPFIIVWAVRSGPERQSGARQPSPLRMAFNVQNLKRLTSLDQVFGKGNEGDVEVSTDILFTPRVPPIKPVQVLLEVHSKRIPATATMGDITQQVSHPYSFIVPKGLAKDTEGRIVITTDQGEAHSKSQRIRFSKAET